MKIAFEITMAALNNRENVARYTNTAGSAINERTILMCG